MEDFPNWVGLVISEKTLYTMEDLNLNDDLSFDDWFDLFQDRARILGYNGPIDKYSFEWNYEEGEAPESAADSFVKEMNSIAEAEYPNHLRNKGRNCRPRMSE